jgi:Tat protein secretion system quality control protein TatD with DNase activity
MMDANVPDFEEPPKPVPEANDMVEDIDRDDPNVITEGETGMDEEGQREAPPRFSSIVTTDSSVLKLCRREPMITLFEDHFSLPASSNLVRFRHRLNAARVYDEGGFQTVLEEEHDQKTDTATITVKKMKDSTSGTTILRISYSIVTALWTG